MFAEQSLTGHLQLLTQSREVHVCVQLIKASD